jgi:hypothetical protein
VATGQDRLGRRERLRHGRERFVPAAVIVGLPAEAWWPDRQRAVWPQPLFASALRPSPLCPAGGREQAARRSGRLRPGRRRALLVMAVMCAMDNWVPTPRARLLVATAALCAAGARGAEQGNPRTRTALTPHLSHGSRGERAERWWLTGA